MILGQLTKACHGAEGGAIRGSAATRTEFGDFSAEAFGAFFRSGTIPDDQDWSLFSYQAMDYSLFNAISSKRWGQFAIRQRWAECEVMDKLHEKFNWYNFGMDGIDDDSMVESTLE